jgi:group I intron endonuclease
MVSVKIYVLKDPETNEPHYVGRSVQPEVRYRQHIYMATKAGKKDIKTTWVRSILDKGLKPTLEIIDECKPNDAQLRETYWIEEYKKNDSLKNQRDFVENGYWFSEDSRKKMSESAKGNTNSKGKKRSPEKAYNCGNANRGKPRSLEVKLKLSKPVIQLTLANERIKEWNSTKDAAKSLSISQRNISSVCNELRKTAGGYKWTFKNKI